MLKLPPNNALQVRELPVSGLFFAIGHEPATRFLDGQLKLDSEGYIVTEPGACMWCSCTSLLRDKGHNESTRCCLRLYSL